MLAASIQYATTALRGLINKGRQFGRQMAEERKAKKEQKEREHARRVLAAGQGGTKTVTVDVREEKVTEEEWEKAKGRRMKTFVNGKEV